MKRPIAIALSPNTTKEDVFLALSLFFRPWRYRQGASVMLLEQWFRQYFHVSHAISFVSGRGSLYALLQAMGVGKNDEVILQSFTCAVVPNAVVARGATPIYVEIDTSLTMDPSLLEKAITKKTKVIVLQHTFGIPSSLDTIMAIAKKHNIPVIEDVAHVIGGTWNKQLLGTFGIASFFSFGRDKAFSSVFGGMVITNNHELGKKMRAIQRVKKNPPFWWIAQQLFHPIAFAAILPWYDMLSLGKLLLIVLQKLHLLSFPVSKQEKQGGFDQRSLSKLPNALANLALVQVRRVKEYNARRDQIVSVYREYLTNPLVKMPYTKKATFLRFPILVSNERDALLGYLKKHGVYIGTWYASGIDPEGVDFQVISYIPSQYPVTQTVARTILNLPTYPTMTTEDAKKIATLINDYDKNSRNN